MSCTKLRIALILAVWSMAAIPCSSHVLLAAAQNDQPEIFVGDPTEEDAALRSGETAIRKVLRRKIAFRIEEDELLSKAIARLQREHRIPIVFDRVEMEQVEGIVPVETRMPALDCPRISLGAALEVILREFELTWVIDKDVLLITTREKADQMLTTKVYEVADLVMRRDEQGRPLADYQSLEELITTNVRAESWEEVGGPGTISRLRYRNAETLVVRQTARMHEKIAQLLADIRAVASPQEDQPVAAGKARSGDRAIRRALQKKITMRCKDELLEKVVAKLQQECGIVIALDRAELEQVLSVEPSETLVSCDCTDITLRSALELMLEPLLLTWVIDREVLLITTFEKADQMLSTKIYDVADLVRYRDEQGRTWADFGSLEGLITKTILQPDSWCEPEPGTISHFCYQNVETLVVSQPRRVHEEIEKLLTNLRAVAQENRRKHGEALPPLKIIPRYPPGFFGLSSFGLPPSGTSDTGSCCHHCCCCCRCTCGEEADPSGSGDDPFSEPSGNPEGGSTNDPQANFEALEELIRTTVHPESWEEGPGGDSSSDSPAGDGGDGGGTSLKLNRPAT
ncbi:MAG: hypothetical protein HQ581_15260 [Planctomycetes bacterium]|nr:hypothetical protein [Planctomycetota bacterium]